MSPSLLRNSLFSFSVKTNWTRLEDLWGAIGSKHVYSSRTKNVNRATDTLGSIDMQGPSLHQWTFLPYDLKFGSNVAFRGLEDFTHTSSTSQLTHSLYRRGMPVPRSVWHPAQRCPEGDLGIQLCSSGGPSTVSMVGGQVWPILAVRANLEVKSVQLFLEDCWATFIQTWDGSSSPQI